MGLLPPHTRIPDRFRNLSGIIYMRFKIRVRIKASTIIKRTKNDPYTILPFSICSAVGKASKEPKTSRKISATMMIATTIERIIHNAFFIYYSPFIAGFAVVLQILFIIHFHHLLHYNTNRQRKQVFCRNCVLANSPLRITAKTEAVLFCVRTRSCLGVGIPVPLLHLRREHHVLDLHESRGVAALVLL